MSRALNVLPALSVGVMLSGVLAGCSVNIVDGSRPDAAPSGTAESPSAPPDVEEPPAEGEEPPAEGEEPPASGDALTREQLIGGATRVMRCDGELTILDDAVLVYVEGDCDRLILNSTGSQVATDDVAMLEVIGDANVVLSGTIDALLVNGTGNVVHWTGDTPSVTDVGDANVLTAG